MVMQASRRQQEEQEKLLRDFELRRRIRSTVVPTDDAKVRTMLRALGEPITLFGEREVRVWVCIWQRLKRVLSTESNMQSSASSSRTQGVTTAAAAAAGVAADGFCWQLGAPHCSAVGGARGGMMRKCGQCCGLLGSPSCSLESERCVCVLLTRV
jgi:hypothetical protein